MPDIDAVKILSSGVFALLGASLGVVASFWIQKRSAQLEREKLSNTVRGRVNALSIAVFREFLAACKRVEGLGERRENGLDLDNDEITAATSQMWLRWEEVRVFCDPRIDTLGLKFVDALQHVAWQVTEPGVTAYLKEPKKALFDVAGPIFREEHPAN